MMKRIIAFCLLYNSMFVYAQEDTTSLVKYIQAADSSALGTPDGESTSKIIGAAGGKIISSDGRVELIFPAGALTTNTTISIQPTTNPLVNGAGKAYWFEPSGTQFKKPVEFLFHYNDEEEENCPPDLMGIALQDKKGKWTYLDYEDWDSVSKTLKGYIHHFTGATSVYQVYMHMSRTELRVNQSASIDFVSYITGDEALFLPEQRISWKVNNVVNGNDVIGTIRQLSFRIEKKARMVNAVYTAPNILPVSDTQRVLVELYVKHGKRREVLRSFKRKVTIYDEYKILVVNEFTGRLGMGSKLIDSASALVRVFHHRIQIENIQNYEPIVLKQGQRIGCKESITVAGQKGTVHFPETGGNLKITHYPPEIYFEFPTSEIPICTIVYRCRGGTVTEPVNMTAKSIPEEINFLANGEKQVYNVTTGNNHIKYKLIVTPARPVRPTR